MIKKYLLWLWISLFWFVWFWYCFPDLISVVPWEAYNWDNIYVDNFSISTDLTFTKPVTYINSNLNVEYAFYWDQYWYLHFFANQQNWKSDYIINSYILTNWSWNDRELSQSEFINYVNNNSVYKVDFYFWYSCQNSYNNWTTFSIHFDNWNYIYFAWGVCQWNNLYVTPWGWPKQSPTNWTIAWLFSFSSPFWNKSSSEWWSVSVWWDVVYWNCTNWQALQWYRNSLWIDDYVCYWWLDSFDFYTWDYLVTPWKWLTVFDLYEYDNFNGFYSWFNDWLQTRSYNYTQYINWNSNTTFDSDPAVFKTYFWILYRTFWPAREIHDYCRLLINSDLNWNLRDNSYIPSSVKNELCENIVNNNNVVNPWQSSNESWTVVSSDWSWIWNSNVSWSNLSWWTPVYDWTNFINTYFNKLKWNSSNPYWTWNWIIPWYIIVALMGVFFFKFLRK